MLKKFLHKTLKRPFRLFVRYDIRPQTEEVTVLFLHGIAVDASFWHSTISKIEGDKNFDNTRIIAIDLLGGGNSPAPEWLGYTVNDHVGAIKKTVKSLGIKTPLIIVGHSMGGILALNFAMKNKVEQIMAISSPIISPVTDRTILEKFNAMSIKTIGAMADANPVLYSIAKSIHTLSNRKNYDMNKPAFRKTLKHVILENDSMGNIRKLSIPIYLLRGASDVLSNHQNYRIISKEENVVVHEVPISGHQIRGPLMTAVLERLAQIVHR